MSALTHPELFIWPDLGLCWATFGPQTFCLTPLAQRKVAPPPQSWLQGQGTWFLLCGPLGPHPGPVYLRSPLHIHNSAPEISPACAPRRGLCEISDRSEYQFNFNGRQALFIHTTHSLKLVSISSYKSESQSPLQPPFKQALCCCFRPPDVRNLWRLETFFTFCNHRAPIFPSSCFSCFYVFSVLTVRLRSSARLCVLQPLGRFHAGGGGSAEASLPPRPLAQLHLPELDPGCWPSCRHGNKTMTSA